MAIGKRKDFFWVFIEQLLKFYKFSFYVILQIVCRNQSRPLGAILNFIPPSRDPQHTLFSVFCLSRILYMWELQLQTPNWWLERIRITNIHANELS